MGFLVDTYQQAHKETYRTILYHMAKETDGKWLSDALVYYAWLLLVVGLFVALVPQQTSSSYRPLGIVCGVVAAICGLGFSRTPRVVVDVKNLAGAEIEGEEKEGELRGGIWGKIMFSTQRTLSVIMANIASGRAAPLKWGAVSSLGGSAFLGHYSASPDYLSYGCMVVPFLVWLQAAGVPLYSANS